MEDMTARKNAIIGGIHGSMMDGDGLTEATRKIEESFTEAVHYIYTGKKPDADVTEEIEDNPFYSSMKVPGSELMDTDQS